MMMKQSIDLKIEGIPFQSDVGNFVHLKKGINLVGLPVKVPRVNRVSDVLQLGNLKDNISSIIVLSPDGYFDVVSRPGDPGDVNLTIGQALVIVAKQDVVFKLSGEVRTDFSNPIN